MAEYSLDVGFNLGSLGNSSNSQQEALLIQGFTRIGVHGNPVVAARRLKGGDTLKVTLYDLTCSGESGGTMAVINGLSLRITFSPAGLHQPVSPVGSDGDFDEFLIYGAPFEQKSTVFDEKTPVWFASLGGNVPFYGNQLQEETLNYGDIVFTLENAGSFYYTIELAVYRDGIAKPKKFRVDPEMIITTGGDPDPPEIK
ncbi:MAG: hypothetical protein AAF604_23440 [Acidobacteriota bacterium]